MTELFAELLNVIIPYASASTIKLYPMWKTRDIKARTVFVFICCLALYLCAGFLIVKRFWAVDFRVMQLYKACASLPSMLLPFAVFRRRYWQNIFLLAVSLMYGSISVGMGMYVGENWFASAYTLLAANIASVAVISLTLPPLLFLLRRLCENPHMKQAGIWRVIWILPTLFFGMFLLTGSPFDVNNFHGNAFLIYRALIYGVLLFTCYLLETALRQAAENAALKENAYMTERLLAMQREQYERLTGNIEQARAARHDLRYQLTVLKGYGASGELAKLNVYLDELTGALPPAAEELYCQNYAVNSVVSHYLGLARAAHIAPELRLEIPESAGQVPDTDLCVIMGNLLENAVEACARLEQGSRFIRVHSRVQGNYLSLMVENSFDGRWRERGGVYLSRKNEGGDEPRQGVGLSSVRAICVKYDGILRVEAGNNVWRSSVLVDMKMNVDLNEQAEH